MKRTALKRYTPLRPRKRSRAEVIIGKFTGKIRLKGRALENLRYHRWMLDLCTCQECGIKTHWKARYDGDPEAFDLAHIQSRGASGSDVLENVRTLCHRCHMSEHTQGRRS